MCDDLSEELLEKYNCKNHTPKNVEWLEMEQDRKYLAKCFITD